MISLVLLLSLALSASALQNLVANKQYAVNELIEVNVSLIKQTDIAIEIASSSSIYRYLEIDSDIIQFIPQTEDKYTFYVLDSNRENILFFTDFVVGRPILVRGRDSLDTQGNVSDLQINATTNDSINNKTISNTTNNTTATQLQNRTHTSFSVDKTQFETGEQVKISFINNSNLTYELRISNDQSVYTINANDSTQFRVQEVGQYTITAIFNNKSIQEINILVIEKPKGPISIAKQQYQISENVLIQFNDPNPYTVRIRTEQGISDFERTNQSSISYVPKEIGRHTVVLLDGFIERYSLSFDVIEQVTKETEDEPKEEQNKTEVSEPKQPALDVIKKAFNNTVGNVPVPNLAASEDVASMLKIKDLHGQNVEFEDIKQIRNSKRLRTLLAKEDYTVELKPIRKKIKRVVINKLQIENNLNLHLDDVSEDIIEIQGEDVVSAFAVDPTELQFEQANITVVARGTELYKCATWNFSQNRCPGTWEKLMDLTPGQEYNITLTPKDPGFAESIDEVRQIAQVYQSVDQNAITTTGEAITFENQTALDDDRYTHDQAGLNTRLEFDKTGSYKVSYSCMVAQTSGTSNANRNIWQVLLRENGATPHVPSIQQCYNKRIDTNSGNCSMSGTTIFNATAGDYLELFASRVNGGEGAETQDDCWMYADDIRYPAALIYDTVGGQNIENQQIITLNLNQDYYIDESAFTFVTDGIDVNQDGWYKIYYHACAERSSGNRAAPEAWILVNGETIPGSRSMSYIRQASEADRNCNTGYLMRDLSLGDTIQVQYGTLDDESTGAIDTLANQGWLLVEQLEIESNDFVFAYENDGTQTAVGGGNTAMNFDTDVHVGDSYSRPTDARVQFEDAGTYEVSYGFGWDDGGANGRTNACAEIRLNGDTYLDSTRACDWSRGDTQAHWNSVSGTAVINVSADDYLELVVTPSGVQVTSFANTTWIAIVPLTRNIKPNITSLPAPLNDTLVTESPVDFNFTPIDVDSNLQNCTLYINTTGTFEANETIQNPINNSINNITITPADGVFLWNVLCYDEQGASSWYQDNFTVSTSTPPDITGVVTNDGPIEEFNPITFTGSCQNEGDIFRLLVCNSTAPSCNTLTDPSLIICNGTNTASTSPTCTFTPDRNFSGTHTGDIATCCDIGQTCDPNPVTVEDWTILGAPVMLNDPSDQGSDVSQQTLAGTDVNFSVTAQSPNGDEWYILVCPGNETTDSGGCPLPDTPYCQSNAEYTASGGQASCLYTTQPGADSGNISWFAFACNNESGTAILCSSPGENSSGVIGSPFYVNNIPTASAITSNMSYAKQNDDVTMYSIGQADQEGDTLRIHCGDSSGVYNLCNSTTGLGQRNCSFTSPYTDQLPHTIYCVMNDTNTLSAEFTETIVGDNARPNVTNIEINDTDLIVNPNLIFRINLSANDSRSGVINVSVYNESTLYMQENLNAEWEINTTASLLGCEAQDGPCDIHFIARDNVSFENSSELITITIDNIAPSVINPIMNITNRIVRSAQLFNLLVTATDTNTITHVYAINETRIDMQAVQATNDYTINTTASQLGCTTNNGYCNITFIAEDIANNTNDTVVLGITVDDIPPQVTNPQINDSDVTVKTTDHILLNITVIDSASTVENVSVILDGVKNASVIDGNLTGEYTDFGGNHTNITHQDNNSYWYVGNENLGVTPYVVNVETEILFELDEFTSVRNLKNTSLDVVYCHTGRAASIVRCDGVAPTGTVETDQTVQFFNYSGETWNSVGNLENDADGTGGELTTSTFEIDGSSDYVNASSNEVKIRLRAHFTNALLTHTTFLVLDYVRLDVAGTEIFFSQIETSNKWQLNTTAYDLGCSNPNGLCSLNFSAIDTAGNRNESEQLNITVDDIPPSVTVPEINDSDRIIRSTDIFSLNVTVTDTHEVTNVTVENLTNIQMYRIDTLDKWTVNTTASDLGCESENGICNLTFIATDSADNINNSVIYGITIDDIPPNVTLFEINDSDGILTSDQIFSINITVTDTNSVINTTVENETLVQMFAIQGLTKWTVNTTAADLGCSGNGICNLSFVGTDVAGNQNISEVYGILIDNGPPSVTNQNINDSDKIITSYGTYNFSALITDGSGVVAADINDTTLTQLGDDTWFVVTQASVFGCAEGNCTIGYNATDLQGNYNDTEELNLTIDDTPPSLVLVTPNDGAIYSTTNVQLNFTATDAIDSNMTCNLTVDNVIQNAELIGAQSGDEVAINVTGLSEGTHDWNVTCVDEIPHVNESETRSFIVDLNAPVVNISTPLNNTEETADSTITFTYNTTDFASDVSSCILILNGEQNGAADTSITEDELQTFVRSLSNGLYDWSVNCTDQAGRVGESPFFNLSVLVLGDLSPALITLNEPEDNEYTNNNTVNFTYTPSDSSGILNCTLFINGEENATCGSGKLFFENFTARTQINITENSGTAQTEYQVNITVDTHALITAGQMQTDCRDIAFADDAANQLSFYLDPVFGCDNESSRFWVQLDEIEAYETKTIYMYYNNPSIDSRSNKYAVFNYSTPTPIMYVVDPLTATTNTLTIASFVDGNTIQVGATSQVIDEYEQIEFQNSALSQAMSINSTGPFASSHNFTPITSMDALAPISFANEYFVNRIDRGTARYYVFAPFGDADVEIRSGANWATLVESNTVSEGTVWTSSVDTSDNTAVLINTTNSVPIIVVYSELTSTDDAFVMHPPDSDWYGVASNNLDIGIMFDNTNVTVYESDGTVNTAISGIYNAGDQATTNTQGADGGSGSNGDEASLYVYSNNTIGVLQVADSDGTETTTFLPPWQLDTEYYVPANYEYITITTIEPTTSCNIVDATDTIIGSGTTDADAFPYPGRLYFGGDEQTNQGPVKVNCSAPFMMYFELEDTGSSNQGDEHNVWNVKQFRKFAGVDPDVVIGGQETQAVPQCIVINNEVNNFTVHNMEDNLYEWNITCYDTSSNANQGNSTTQNVTVDTTLPTAMALILSPNGTITNNLNIELNWSETVDVNFANYTIQIDDSQLFDSVNFELYETNINLANITPSLAADTTYYWRVIAFDLAGNNYTTENFSVTTDNTNPTVSLSAPGNNDWINNSVTGFTYTPSDTHLKNCSLYANFTGTFEEVASDITPPTSGVQNTFNNVATPEGIFVWNVQCFDNASNFGWASSNFTTNVDISPPNTTLDEPVHLYNASGSSVTFRWTPSDNLANTNYCNLTIDGVVNESLIAVTNNEQASQAVTGFDEGNHTWNVTCLDLANNSNTSVETRLFTIDTSAPDVTLVSPSNNTQLELAQSVTFEYIVNDTLSSIANCSLTINNVLNQTQQNVLQDTTHSFSSYLTAGDYNWSVNCTDSQLQVGASDQYIVTIAPPLFIQTVEPANGTILDRDKVNDQANDNTSLIARLSNGAEGITVSFYANITDPSFEGLNNTLLGTDESNSTGYARLNFSATDNVGSKLYAGNYTWWAEATLYFENGTAQYTVFGGLNVSFRFEDELPELYYSANGSSSIQEFLKSLGPESDGQVNTSYNAFVNTTFLQQNGSNYTVILVDPEILPEDDDRRSGSNINSNDKTNNKNEYSNENNGETANNYNGYSSEKSDKATNQDSNEELKSMNKVITTYQDSKINVISDKQFTQSSASEIKNSQAQTSNEKETTITKKNKETARSGSKTKLKSTIINSKNKKISSQLTFYDKNGKLVEKISKSKGALGLLEDIGLKSSPQLEVKEYDVEFIPENSSIERIYFNDVNYTGSFDLGIDTVATSDVNLSGRPVLKSYAIDPTGVNFSTAQVTSTASGNALYKCEEWNFSTQTCYGSWKKILKLTPGQKYNFTIEGIDPGFAESNISIINVQSFPTVFNNWTVKFNTSGTANLTIRAVKGTKWSNNNDSEDLRFVNISCGSELLSFEWINDSVFIPNYYCEETSFEISQVNTKGKHSLEFTFGEDVAYANNFANFFYDLGFEDFEDSFAQRTTGACSNGDNCLDPYGNFSWCDSATTGHHICTTTDAALLGSRSGLWDDIDGTAGTIMPIWGYVFNATTACGGLQCDNIIVEFYVAPVSLDNANERCSVQATDSDSTSTIYDCTGADACEAATDPPGAGDYDFESFNLNETAGIDFTGLINITLGGYIPGGQDHCYWDNVNITGFHFNRPPNVTILIQPSNNSHQNITPLDFNYTVTDEEDPQLENCTLYTNFTGTWQANETLASVNSGVISNFTVAPDDGNYIWNVLCFDENGDSDWHDHNFSVLVNATPQITQTVSTPGAADIGDNIVFSGICENPGDYMRLFVCNSTATSCGVTTPGNLVICEGSNSLGGNISCTYTTNVTYGGTNTGMIAGCCDDGNLCDEDTIPVDDWTVNAPPTFTKAPSDNGSDILAPTADESAVNFSANATDPNNDAFYRLLVCNTSIAPTETTTCFGPGTLNQYCTGIASNEEVAHCTYDSTAGLSGNYSWWAFICDDNFCSSANNGTFGTPSASPFYINNNATMLNVTANQYVAQFGDSITIITDGASDQENDAYRLQCGNESTGPFDDVCAGTYGFGERSCTFTYPYNDNDAHTFFCVLNDTFSISPYNTTTIYADNLPPVIVLNQPENNSYHKNLVQFNYTPTDVGLDDCQLYGSWISSFGLNQTERNPTSGIKNSFEEITLPDGAYLWNVLCNDTASGTSWAPDNFTVNIDTTPPGIDLVSPPDLTVEETSNTVTFEYEVNDAGANITSCTLIVNGTANESVADPEEANPNNEIISVIPDGHYNWSINCTDFAGNTNQSLSRLITLSVANNPPSVSLVSPENNGYAPAIDINLTYIVTDDKGLNNCTLFFDGEENQTDFAPAIGELNNFSINGTELGTHNWTVACHDNAEQVNQPSEYFFEVDLLAPETQLITPANDSQFTDSDRVPFRYNVTDNLPASMANCSLFINDQLSSPSQTNVQINATQTFLRTLENQRLYWHVSCIDQAGNNHTSDTWNLTVNASLKIWNGTEPLIDKPEGIYAVNTNAVADYFFPVYLNDTRNMTLDKSPPEINLSSPVNNTNTTELNITFSYNVSDLFTNVSECELIIDNVSVLTNFTINETGPNNFTYNLSYGIHTWNVNCTDYVGNEGSSDIFDLRILFIDLAVFTANISVSNFFPVEGETVEVNATISNIGDEDALDNFRANITLFTETGLTQVIHSEIITGLEAGTNVTITATFDAPVGNNTISVFADTTAAILELNESNNEANTSVYVTLYHVFTGNISAEIFLSDIENESSYFWDPEDQFEANVFAIDSDSDISWTTLAAVTRNLSHNYTDNDFEDLDRALNTTNITGSINESYHEFNVSKNLTIFNISIEDVPIVNSTNTSAFQTGILWDYSDENTGQYNGSQDVIFVTSYNHSQLGSFGVYDYELRVPAALERYLNPNTLNSITFYTELR